MEVPSEMKRGTFVATNVKDCYWETRDINGNTLANNFVTAAPAGAGDCEYEGGRLWCRFQFQVMVRLLLTAAVRLPEVAVSVYVPATLILQAEKLATPEDVLLGFWGQVRTAPPAGGVMTRVTEGPLVVTVLPPAS
jgi:hypothetical protein